MTAVSVTAPLAIHAPVTNDVDARTLVVRRPENIGGYAKLMWRESHEALVRAEEAGWPLGYDFVWGGAFGDRQIVHAAPGANLTLRFHFPLGVRVPVGGNVYAKLISKPGLFGIVTMDRERRRFLSCRFNNRL